ncbi:RluA family pseudouridine synthase [Paenibacillus harenae]|uniref:RluA family pseudouridine synthase n=1 Tax=Paenibacillus harenae TaxID=306543 RepID=UPI002794D9D2|nr:RluA family pseudouridine synthase [Paenibacillus harenae]MDQ0061273.1 23S rRNA pseudouridine1911/1915/1917 synthase [Paenibacillus harenae]
MRIEQAVRNGEWLELDWESLAGAEAEAAEQAQPKAGSHPHEVRKWLLARGLFSEKWVNRLFSVGGIRWENEKLRLLTFPAVDPKNHPFYRQAISGPTIDIPPVLYEDDFCIVFHKPAGMKVHESYAGERGTLDEAAARHALKAKDPLPLRHIHRLDDYTSGPVLYAKCDLAQWNLDEAMRDKAIDRQYIAVVQGKLAKRAGTVDEPIGKDRHHRARRMVTSSGEHAVTHYEKVEVYANASIVRVRLETGRTHQIRVHLSYIGHPIVGDELYGGSTRLLTHQALHGERLLFPHPWSGETVEVAAPWPSWLEKLVSSVRGM